MTDTPRMTETAENPYVDVVTVAWSKVDVMQAILDQSDPEIARLGDKVLKTQQEVTDAQQAVTAAEAEKVIRQANLDAALAELADVSTANPELAAEASSRRP